jgi:hypothetical protein
VAISVAVKVVACARKRRGRSHQGGFSLRAQLRAIGKGGPQDAVLVSEPKESSDITPDSGPATSGRYAAIRSGGRGKNRWEGICRCIKSLCVVLHGAIREAAVRLEGGGYEKRGKAQLIVLKVDGRPPHQRG